MNSDFASANCACAASAAPRASAGRSRGSWMPRKLAITSISRSTPCTCAATSMRASFTSTGSFAIALPMAVSLRLASTAPSSFSCCQPSATARESGGSRNGKSSMLPSPSDSIRRITPASAARRISGSVNSGREA